ncbi:DUF3956 family protein [Haladaptatus halobius]
MHVGGVSGKPCLVLSVAGNEVKRRLMSLSIARI